MAFVYDAVDSDVGKKLRRRILTLIFSRTINGLKNSEGKRFMTKFRRPHERPGADFELLEWISRSLSMTISLSRCAVAGLRTARPMSQEFFSFVKGTGDDVNADEFSNAAGCDGTRFSHGFHGTHIAAKQDGDVAVEEVFLANEDSYAGK